MKKTFFTKDPSFYRSFFKLMTVIALQNLVAYSVNMLDNIMLGSYSQNALSGAATVNQIYFIVNQIALAIGNALIAISSQYWGSHQTKPIRKVTKAALLFSLAIAAGMIALCIRIPNTLIGLFTTSPDIIREGTIYLHQPYQYQGKCPGIQIRPVIIPRITCSDGCRTPQLRNNRKIPLQRFRKAVFSRPGSRKHGDLRQ